MDNKKFQMGKVCELTGLTHSTIRFWEKHFPILQPYRSAGGHRYYSEEQINTLNYLKKLLHQDGYTLEGAKKKLSGPAEQSSQNDASANRSDIKNYVKEELLNILNVLKK